jgi:adenylate cyclase
MSRRPERWRRSPFYKMLQTGDSVLRRRLSDPTEDEFSPLSDLLAAGMTDYAAIITRFGADGIIGEMDGVYSSWTTGGPVDSTMAKSTPFSASRHTSRLPSNRYRSRA